MGYSTRYKLECHPQPGYKPSPSCNHPQGTGMKFCPECGVPVKLLSLSDRISAYIILKQQGGKGEMSGIERDGSSADDARWYGHAVEMKAMSMVFPKVLFLLTGWGEQPGDYWRMYFLEGLSYKVSAQFPPFNRKAMK
jgi:hypothetical protein